MNLDRTSFVDNLKSLREEQDEFGADSVHDTPDQSWFNDENAASARSRMLRLIGEIAEAARKLEQELHLVESERAELLRVAEELRRVRAQPAPAQNQADDSAPAGGPVKMRDMANFIFSREGEHFLHMLRRVVREEIESHRPVHAAPASMQDAEESGEAEDSADEFEQLRRLVSDGFNARRQAL